MNAVFVMNNGKVYIMPKTDTYEQSFAYIEGAFDTGYLWYKGVAISFDMVERCLIQILD